MKTVKKQKDEKGAALITVLMLSALLLAAIGGLLVEVAMNTANISDATADQQAYNAAESGIQSAINVLRGNVVTDISYRKAVTPLLSNLNGDSSTNARMSRWLNYNYTPSGAARADRVTLSSGYNPQTGRIDSSYNPRNGYAFDVVVVDPDNTGQIITYGTQGLFYDKNEANSANRWKSSLTFGGLTISYTKQNPITIDVSSGLKKANYGTFTVTGSGVIPDDVRFKIVNKLTAPYTYTREMFGYIKAGTVTPTTYSSVKFDFDSAAHEAMGIFITLDNITIETVNSKNNFIMKPNAVGILAVTGDTTQPEPFRLVLTATGYGPRGAKKVLEATIQKNLFNGMTVPSTVLLLGPKVNPANNNDQMVFEPGESANVTYSGKDIASEVIIPPIGTTNDANLETVLGKIDPDAAKGGFKGNITGESANVDADLPFWLQSTTNLNAQIEQLKLAAGNNYFKAGETVTNVGDNATARGLTVVDGNFTLSPSTPGGGILIVTGKLTLHGNFNFNGLIIVTGTGGVKRTGGGTGLLQGNIVIAPYNPAALNNGFLPPKYDISGGGNSAVQYNSSSIANGMLAVSNYVLGVKEK